ncbi:hypothetical protein BGZ51_005969 [Haplosporangium sp. Z 767]|nr:hypothetical protein BGZ51_005969 [Haplosporangium sp. Z 767]
MDELIFPQPAPAPLILPRRHSIHGSNRLQHIQFQRQGQQQQQQDVTKNDLLLGGNQYTRCFYYPTAVFGKHRQQSIDSTQSANQGTATLNSSPVSLSFGSDRGKDGFVAAAAAGTVSGGGATSAEYQAPTIATIHGRTSRRHSVAAGSPWTAVPPRHALHMPVMKVNPEIWRRESHQREIHRLMHEGREEEVMRRRNIRSVMDTSEEDDDETDMKDIVMTMDLGGFKATEERERERVRQEVMQEWRRIIEEQTHQQMLQQTENTRRRRSWPNISDQQRQAHFLAQRAASIQEGGVRPIGSYSFESDLQRLQHQRQAQQQMQLHLQQQQQYARIPDQLSSLPKLQRGSSFNNSVGPLDRTVGSIGSPLGSSQFSENPRQTSFTSYRG